MKRINLLILLILGVFTKAQDYIPIDTADGTFRTQTKTIYQEKFDGFLDKIKNDFKGKTRREMLESLEGLKDNISEEIEEGEFIYNTAINDKIEEIYQEIYTKNSWVPKDFNLLLSKNLSLNAYCMPDGTMVVHAGAVYYLDNEDQLAVIICHELGHKLLDHSIKNISEEIEDRYSKERKNKIKSLKREKYNLGEKSFQLLRQLLYAEGEKNRRDEFQADSIGYELFKNTKYKKAEAKYALELILKYDTIKPKGLEPDIYKKIFDLPDLPFNEKWLEKEDFSKYDYSLFEEKLEEDSIKTHPEAEERIKYLEKLFPELKNAEDRAEKSEEYANLQEIAKNEQVPSLYFQEKYGLGIYYSLYRLQQGYLEDYHKKWLGKCFQKMYEARKNYTANRYLDRVSPDDQSPSYQQFLNFMWNLSLSEIETIANYYNKE